LTALWAASDGVAITLAATSIAAPTIRRMMQNSKKSLYPRVRPKNGRQDTHPAWRWVSERGLRLATGEATLAYHVALSSQNLPEIEDIIPADGSLLLVLRRGARVSADWLTTLAAPPVGAQSAAGLLHEIPVRYGGAAGPDLPAQAERAGLDMDTYISKHSAVEYTVAFLGFQPGFPYLRGLPHELAAPRRASPRTRVAAGSVAIGGVYCGIYPASGPGGWQIIGHTEIVMFDPRRDLPARLMPGDRVRFVAA
jgi:KipI family sensor histidine kinase inhibitor